MENAWIIMQSQAKKKGLKFCEKLEWMKAERKY